VGGRPPVVFQCPRTGKALGDTAVAQEGTVSDPQGSDRIQQDIPTASGTGDNSSTGTGFDDVPLTREEAVERDAAQPDDLPAKAESDPARAERGGSGGSV
jgi:hypothetical protein